MPGTPSGTDAPGPVAIKAADDALANIGVLEDGPPYQNHGKYVEVYLASTGLGPGYSWCAAFVHYREIQAAHALGLPLPPSFPRGGTAASVASWADWAKSKGLWFSPGDQTVRRGDLVCFWIESEGGLHHIGIVTDSGEPGSETFHTVEGNGHPDGSPIRDGYGVFPRHRSYSDLGSGGGFIRLPW